MKAWDELVKDKDKQIYWTSYSDYYIEHGVKIERFHEDGRIEVKNTMTSNLHFEEVPPWIRCHFNNMGWMEGCMHLNIYVYNSRLKSVNNLIRLAISRNRDIQMIDTLRERRRIIQKKINKCRDRLTKND